MDFSGDSWDEALPELKGFMFDVDGTLVLGDRAGGGYQVLPGAVEVLTELNARGVPFVLLTNGSAYPAAVQAPRLRDVGLPVEDWQMLTPSSVTADVLSRAGVRRALILGSPGVGHALQEAGIEIVFTGGERATEVDAVYVGWHPDCGMKDIETACKAIWNGAKMYVASDVPFFATREGKTIGYSHAIVAAIRSLTKARATITGKPSLHAMRYVARKLGAPIASIGVVGDDPQLETAMARKAGAAGFGVATGLLKAEDWAAQPPARRPHRVLGAVGELLTRGFMPQSV
jgi:HAD superfamily hydrolase (TIGR01450 family)